MMLNTPLRAEGTNIYDNLGNLVAEAVSKEMARIIVNFVNAVAAQ